MNKTKNYEMNLIRSRALAVLFSLILSALILLPFITSAKGKNTAPKNTSVFMHVLNKDAHAAVTVNSIANGRYTLSIESENGSDIYYNEVLTDAQFAKIFDFSNLEDGEYTLKIKSKHETNYRLFDIVNGEIKVYYEESVEPKFRTKGEKAFFEIENRSNLEYAIRILNTDGEELFYAKDNKSKIKKAFDFSNLEKGNYQVLVSSNKANFAFDYQKED